MISKDDLIISKLWWAKDSYSEKQLSDVVNLLSSGFDEDYLENWLDELGVRELFEECLQEMKK